jgi:hypothetical protein
MPSDCGFHAPRCLRQWKKEQKKISSRHQRKGDRTRQKRVQCPGDGGGRKLTAWGVGSCAGGAAGGWSRRGGATAVWRPRASSRAPAAWRRRAGGKNGAVQGLPGAGIRNGVVSPPEWEAAGEWRPREAERRGERWGFWVLGVSGRGRQWRKAEANGAGRERFPSRTFLAVVRTLPTAVAPVWVRWGHGLTAPGPSLWQAQRTVCVLSLPCSNVHHYRKVHCKNKVVKNEIIDR